MNKKILGLLLVCMMVFSLFSMTVFAAAGDIKLDTKNDGMTSGIDVYRNAAGNQVFVVPQQTGQNKAVNIVVYRIKPAALDNGYGDLVTALGVSGNDPVDNENYDENKLQLNVDFVMATATDATATVTLPATANGTWTVWACHEGKATDIVSQEVNVVNGKIVGDQSDLVFDLKGGKIGNSTANVTKKVDADTTITLADVKPADPTKEGFIFGGWAETDGGAAVTSVTSDVKDGSKTVYAIWNAKTAPTAADFTVTGNTVDYNATAQHPTVNVAAGKTGMGKITVNTEETDAGTYTITIDVAEGTAYAAVTGLELTPKFEIKQIEPLTLNVVKPTGADLQIAPDEEKELNTVDIEVIALGIGNTNLTGTVAWVTPGDKVKDGAVVHKFKFTPTGASATNYKEKESQVTFLVAGRAETHVTYGNTEVTYNGDPQAVTITSITASDGKPAPNNKQYKVYYEGTGDTTYAKSDVAPTNVGTYTVSVEMTDKDYNNPAETATFTIKKATPTVTPTYTEIKESGKTLADGALAATAKLGDKDVTGTIAWDDADTTEVTKNTSFGWTFTPDDTDNLETVTGTILLWKGTSTSIGSGGSSHSSNAYDVTYQVGRRGEISGSDSESVKANAYPSRVPKVTAKEGYEFKGWSLDGKTIVDPTEVRIKEDTTFTAIFESNKTASLNSEDHIVYIRGYEDGTFGPNKSITRAEAITIFARLMNEKMDADTNYDSSFNDVKAGAWYANYIGYMEDYNIINGYEDGTFRPDAAITRAEFAAMASRFDKLENTDKNAFNDVDGSHWAINSINSAAAKGWIGGYPDGTFRPSQNISRAEVVSIVNNMLGRKINADSIAGAQYNTFSDVASNHWAYYDVIEASNEHDYDKDDAGKNTWK